MIVSVSDMNFNIDVGVSSVYSVRCSTAGRGLDFSEVRDGTTGRKLTGNHIRT